MSAQDAYLVIQLTFKRVRLRLFLPRIEKTRVNFTGQLKYKCEIRPVKQVNPGADNMG